jgi:hypothetical protein
MANIVGMCFPVLPVENHIASMVFIDSEDDSGDGWEFDG